MRTTTSTTLDYIPEPIRAFVACRGAEVVGLGVTGAAAGATLALASWSVDHPSFNHAASGPVHNVLGAPGASAADLIMQLLGLSSIVFLAPPILWGWRLPTTRRFERLTARLMLWLGYSLFSAGLAAMLPSI
jgi:S-DNA-T family DNA segregation ATPase FtsK/SpoIIIE